MVIETETEIGIGIGTETDDQLFPCENETRTEEIGDGGLGKFTHNFKTYKLITFKKCLI